MLNNLAIISVATIGVLLPSASAATIDFGTSWPAFNGINSGNYSSDPLNRVLVAGDGLHSNETSIATFVNSALSTTFATADVHKTESIAELGGADGYFLVPSGWSYLVVQYGGPKGGSLLIKLDGYYAKVPYDSSLIWGDGDKYAVSHYSVIESIMPSTTEIAVPDGGATATLLALGLTGVGCASRRLIVRRG